MREIANSTICLQFVHEHYTANWVLTVQTDTVMCRKFDLSKWQKFAFVGGIWPKRHCHLMENMWRNWHTNFGEVPAFFSPATATSSAFCPERGLVGNGGLSFRSREHMIRAIKYCPSEKFSSLPQQAVLESSCAIRKPRGGPNEDMYYAALMAGLKFNMPTPFEAAIFSSDTETMKVTQAAFNVSEEVSEQQAKRSEAKRSEQHHREVRSD